MPSHVKTPDYICTNKHTHARLAKAGIVRYHGKAENAMLVFGVSAALLALSRTRNLIKPLGKSLHCYRAKTLEGKKKEQQGEKEKQHAQITHPHLTWLGLGCSWPICGHESPRLCLFSHSGTVMGLMVSAV